jgi:hypothetical protein
MAKKGNRKSKKQLRMYEVTAIYAAQLLVGKLIIDPEQAWQQAARALIKSTASRVKNCPMMTFRALGELGLILGGPSAKEQIKPALNNEYTISALKILQTRPELSLAPKSLWMETLLSLQLPPNKKHNEQMTVICGLWNKGMIVGSPSQV